MATGLFRKYQNMIALGFIFSAIIILFGFILMKILFKFRIDADFVTFSISALSLSLIGMIIECDRWRSIALNHLK
jgi:hypothetical protein